MMIRIILLAIPFSLVAVLLAINTVRFQVVSLLDESRMSSLLDAFRARNLTCSILGGTGETGKALLKEIAAAKLFSRVILIARRKMDFEDEEMRKFVGQLEIGNGIKQLNCFFWDCRSRK